jgi:prevent-host-death family protein
MRVTATEAKNRFGALCLRAKEEPVVIEKSGQPHCVLLSYADYERLQAAQRARQRSRPLSAEYGDWLQAQNDAVDQHGVWSDGLRTW